MCVRFFQRSDFLDGVASDRISQIFFGVFKPGVERGRLLGELKEELFDVPELLLGGQKATFAIAGVGEQFLPACDYVLVSLLNGRTLVVVGGHQLVF